MKRAFLSILFLLPAASGCDQPVPILEYRVLRTLAHDSLAYTQGLVFHDGVFFESTGRHGTSSVRRVDPESGRVLQMHELPEEYFGEGLAMVGEELIQLTWQSGRAFVYDSESLEVLRSYEYEGEGWGLCFDGEALFMSDGGSGLQRRDPTSFEMIDEIAVTKDGFSVSRLNELECVGEVIFANIFQTNRIVRINKRTGEVSGEMDALRLSAATPRAPDPDAVFNGIAYDAVSGHFFVTGKLWPRLFEIEILGR